MSILKYKDPKTGEFKRINPYKDDLSFVGKDGITVNKAANSEEVEISGKGCVQATNTSYILYGTTAGGTQLNRSFADNPSVNAIAQFSNRGTLRTNAPVDDLDCINKKYVADNYVEKVKFTNLEQALNGYILDTTKEAYTDLDSAVLKDSVAVGDNVYPIADKTRALVSRIEGKTTKMVQLFDKSVIPATSTVNGITYTNNNDGSITVNGITYTNNNDGSITINGTATAESYIIVVKRDKITNEHEMLYGSEQNTSNYGFAWGTNLSTSKFNTSRRSNNYTVKVNSGVTVDNVKIYPQLFDLTAMNREDITTIEQFKAELPELYPYENGNIYPAKISGVKFTGKNIINIPNGTGSKDYGANGLPKNISLVLSAKLSLKEGNARVRASWIKNGTREYAYGNTITASTGISKVVFTIPLSATDTRITLQTFGDDVGFEYSNVQIEAGTTATAYEPYIDPVSVTLPETYDLHGIGDYKDYLEITKNENNELYTLKKVQSVEVNESEKTITPLATPVETVIATNLTYEQVTAIRHNGGLIEVEGNTNKGYAKPTIKNTVVYRLTATNTAEA